LSWPLSGKQVGLQIIKLTKIGTVNVLGYQAQKSWQLLYHGITGQNSKCGTGKTVRNLGNFSGNLFQKNIINMFVTSDLCMCDLNAISIQMILIIIIEIYSAAELDALVDIVPVDVVVPLDAVQKGSSADQQQDATKKMIVTDTTTKERTKRVVVPLADTPQKRDCRPSPSR